MKNEDDYEPQEKPLQGGCGGLTMWMVGENSILGFYYYYGAEIPHLSEIELFLAGKGSTGWKYQTRTLR